MVGLLGRQPTIAITSTTIAIGKRRQLAILQPIGTFDCWYLEQVGQYYLVELSYSIVRIISGKIIIITQV